MSLSESIRALETLDSKLDADLDGIEAIAGRLGGIGSLLLGNPGGTIDDSETKTDDLLAAGKIRASQVTVAEAVLLAQKFYERQIALVATELELGPKLISWSADADTALAASKIGQLIARVGIALPGISGIFKTSNVDVVLAEAAKVFAEMKREIGRIAEVNDSVLVAYKSNVASLAAAKGAIDATSVRLFAAGETGAALVDRAGVAIAGATVAATEAQAGERSADRIETALDELGERYAIAIGKVSTLGDGLARGFTPIETLLQTAVVTPYNLILDVAADLPVPVGALRGLPATLKSFVAAVQALATPFGQVFAFFGVTHGDQIDALIESIQDIPDQLTAALLKVLESILPEIRGALSGLLDNIEPIYSPVPELNLLGDLLEAIDGTLAAARTSTAFAGLDDMVDALLVDPLYLAELDPPDAGESRTTFFGGGSGETVKGAAFEPAAAGSATGLAGAVLSGGGGGDSLIGTALADFLLGGAGGDRLIAEAGDDIVFGGSGADRVTGGRGSDVLLGGAGPDQINGNPGADDIQGNSGGDRIAGGSGDDWLDGGTGDDTVIGGSGKDRLGGGPGNDRLSGGTSADTLIGGTGRDFLAGGTRADLFVFHTAAEAGKGKRRDVIEDFRRGTDHIDLSGIDADTTLKGKQGFEFIGSKGFSGEAGELRFKGGIVSAELNGDGASDFEIAVQGVSKLSGGDFLL